MESKINVVSAIIKDVNYMTTLNISGHTFVSDEPKEDGGGDLGPKPTDLLISALASCTVITIKMYASRKEWPLDEVHIESKMERNTDSGIQTTTVFQVLNFIGNLNEEQTKRLLDIASKCPVHKILKPAMSIETRLK